MSFVWFLAQWNGFGAKWKRRSKERSKKTHCIDSNENIKKPCFLYSTRQNHWILRIQLIYSLPGSRTDVPIQ